jgi:putative transposase
MKIRRKFSSEQKAQIVLSVIKKEKSLVEISKEQNLAPSLLHKWKEEFFEKAHTIFEVGKDETDKDRKMKHYEHVIAKITTQNDFLEKVLAVTR